MIDPEKVRRRDFLKITGTTLALSAGAASLMFAADSPASRFRVRIASNPGLENATLNNLMREKGYLEAFAVDAEIIESPGVSGPLDALIAGKADICLISGFNRLIPAIEAGAPVKIVGGAMLAPAHAIYTRNEAIRSLDDLVGKTFGVGEINGLLHALMILRLEKAGIDPASVAFVDRGSNASVYRAVVAGEIDAGLASVSHLGSMQKDAVYLVAGGEMWKDLKEYTFQTSYASNKAITENREALVRTLAAYRALYRHLQSPGSRSDFLAARKAAQPQFDEVSANTVWDFIQENRPYATDLALSEERINYLQRSNLALGLQKQVLPFAAVADMSLAHEALLL